MRGRSSWVDGGIRGMLGSGQGNYEEGNSGQWTVAFGEDGFRSEESEVKLWTVDSDIHVMGKGWFDVESGIKNYTQLGYLYLNHRYNHPYDYQILQQYMKRFILDIMLRNASI